MARCWYGMVFSASVRLFVAVTVGYPLFLFLFYFTARLYYMDV